MEVQTIQSVDHPNIINYYETYEDSRFVYLCMELCTGGELLENTNTSDSGEFNCETKTARIIYSLLSALTHIHAQGIVHRDIKPENIMFVGSEEDGKGEVKLIDFGLACQL